MTKKIHKTRISPKRANELLTCNTYKAQRPLRIRRVKELAQKMKDGRFTTARIALANLPQGTVILVNGQHQLHAIVQTGLTQDAFIEEFTLDRKETQEHLADLFAQFDEGGLRSATNVTQTYLLAYDLDIPAFTGNKIVSALSWLEWKEHYGRQRTKDERCHLLKKYRKEALFVVNILHAPDMPVPKHMARAAVIAAMITTFKKHQTDSANFWTYVRDGEMLKRTDPPFKLRDFLTTVTVAPGGKGKVEKTVSFDEVYYKCLIAWNAYRKDAELRVLMWKGGKVKVA